MNNSNYKKAERSFKKACRKRDLSAAMEAQWLMDYYKTEEQNESQTTYEKCRD